MTMFTRQDAEELYSEFLRQDEGVTAGDDMQSALNFIIAPKVEAMIAAARAEASQGATEADARAFWEREYFACHMDTSAQDAAKQADAATADWRARFMPEKQEAAE